MEITLRIENLFHNYGELRVFDDFSIEFRKNSINCILGPSGCGKTSLLNIIAGLLDPVQSGRNDFKDLTVSYVFQEPRLLPWFTVSGNIEFVLKDRLEAGQIRQITEEYLSMVKLYEFRDYYPGMLSGGMRQRVSLARAFSFPSDLIIMDEPFKGLDIKLKQDVVQAFRLLWEHRKTTVIWVSHDPEESLQPGGSINILTNPPVSKTRLLYSDNISPEILRKELETVLEK